MLNEIRNEAKKRNLDVKVHSKNKITVADPEYTNSAYTANDIRIECLIENKKEFINIGFTSKHQKDFENDCSDWDIHTVHPNRTWAKKELTDVSEFVRFFDRMNNDWKQIICLDNKINPNRLIIMNFIAETWHKAFSIKSEGLIDRNFLDKIDEIIMENNPLPKNNWREHVVPCKVLIQEAKRIFLNGGTVEDIADMLDKNLVIVNIHESDARRLDGEMGLRDSMPEGWEFGDCIFARLDAAGIDY